MAKYDYRGAIHCHSDYSDGTGTFEEIAQAANDSGIDFVMMTDHDTLKPRKDGHEGWKGSTLFLIGTEITPATNHYIVFGEKDLKAVEKLKDRKPQEIIDEVNRQGWFGFIAHPDHGGTKKFGVPSYRWDAWDSKGYAGMGLWDLMTDWQSQLDRDEVSTAVVKEFADWLTGPRPETLKRWDELNRTGKVVGIGEIDNHAVEREHEGEKLKIFPYDVAFRTVLNHVLLDAPLDKDPAKARSQILRAVRHGSLYISFDYWEDPTEFSFEIDDGERTAGMGDEFPIAESAELLVTLPASALINVLRDGVSVDESEGDEAVVEITEPGVYRIEVMRDDLTWILSNPIYVKRETAS